MKILLVNTFYYPEVKGGAEYSVKKLAEALQADGNEITVLASGNTDNDEIIDGIKVHRRKFHSIYHSYGNVNKNVITMIFHRALDFWNPMNRNIIIDILKKEKPDIIHTNNIYEITPIIWKTAKENGIHTVHTIRDYYLMCYKTNLLKKNNEICNAHNIGCRLYQYINRKLTNYVDVLTAPSNMMIKEVEKRRFFEKSQHSVVYNACEFNKENVAVNCAKKKVDSTITFVYLGGFHEHKGIDTLLEAFQNLESSNARLVFAGKGEKTQKIEEAAIKDSRIYYAGFLDESQIAELLNRCDVLVCPSLWNEPFGRVILDAYKSGLPVIASRIGALPEIVQEGKTGILVNPGVSDELKNAMNCFLDNNGFLEECKSNLLAKLSEFEIRKQANTFEKIYTLILKEKDIG